MSKVLSQQEIDALLSALSSGELEAGDIQSEEQKARTYDFRRPNKFSKEHISTLGIIYENYARIMSNYLSSQVRANIKMKQVSIEQVSYEEFTRSMPNPTLLLNFKMPPLGGVLLLEINLQFAFQIIELLCGGKAKVQVPIRELTDIEKNIIQEILDYFIISMKEAWHDVIETNPTLESVESNPQLNQTMSSTDPVALITFVIEVAEVQSFANLCIPYFSIEKIIDKLEKQYWFQMESSQDSTEYSSIIKDKILSTEVDLSILMGSTHITVEDFMSMSVGDVLQLDKQTNETLEMYAEDQMCFHVQPGIYKNKLSVQVVDIVEKDVQFND